MPKGQETVKVQPLDRLDRAGGLELLRERTQPHGVEDRDRGEVQEREIAEAVFQSEVAHAKRRIDALFLRQPGKSLLLVAELVDELDLQALAAGEDAAIGDALDSGMVGVNSIAISTPETPFGGVKESGHGSEGGIEGLGAYLVTKFISQG